MLEFRRVTDGLSVAPQISVADVAEAARLGFRLIINNRPDGEAPGQPTSAEIEAAARAAGLDYAYNPVVGMPTPDKAAAQQALVAGAAGPVLAFCRSGNRSIVSWSLGEAGAGGDRGELADLARAAGYDLSAVLGA